MKMYYSATNKAFYPDDIYGPRGLQVEDPTWIRPTVDVSLLPGEELTVLGQVYQNVTEEVITVTVPDMTQDHPLVFVENPDCTIPNDGVDVPLDDWAAIIEAMALGSTLVPDATGYPTLVSRPPTVVPIKELQDRVDVAVAAVYQNWTRFESEYRSRITAAQTFKTGGYVGDPGIWVSSFASSAGVTNKQAADLILSQAAGLVAAQEQLGALRMRKYEIAALTGEPAIAKSEEILALIKAIADSLN